MQATLTTRTAVPYPIVAAITKADDILGKGRQWNSVNGLQHRFITRYLKSASEIASIPEIESIASRNADEINAFLAARGFQIKLDPFVPSPNEDPFGTASVLDVLVEWLEEGTKAVVVTPDQKEYPGVRISGEGVRYYQAQGVSVEPIISLQTKSGDRVCLTMSDFGDGEDGFDLVAAVRYLSKNKEPFGEYAGVTFPKVDLDQQVDISWLKEMWTIGAVGARAKVTQALQQTKFKMNEKGARAKSGVAIGIMRSKSVRVPPPELVINRPFLLWIERDGLSQPLFAGHVCEDTWRDPGSLDM